VDARYSEQAVLGLARVVARLRGSDERDGALRATLERRGLDADELERLGRLVAEAQRLAEAGVEQAEVEARTEELVALYASYRDWAE
jgi:hypothetical protein